MKESFASEPHDEGHLDTQLVEIRGRHRLVEDIIRDGLEVATPIRDRGTDLIVYDDRLERLGSFPARPIQLKAASHRVFSIHKKYEANPHLLLAFVWHLGDPGSEEVYVLTYGEALDIGHQMGYTNTPSWLDKGAYSTTRPSTRLIALLTKYQMSPGVWRERFFTSD